MEVCSGYKAFTMTEESDAVETTKVPEMLELTDADTPGARLEEPLDTQRCCSSLVACDANLLPISESHHSYSLHLGNVC